MASAKKYQPDDLVLVVWLHRTGPEVLAGEMTWEQAASESWAMSREKAEQVKLLIAVFDGAIRGAWAAERKKTIPIKVTGSGGGRVVHRSTFTLTKDDRLAYLIGLPSPIDGTGRRNPQATAELRDLPALAQVIADVPAPEYGVVKIGAFTLSISEAGEAELRMPAGAVLTVRTAA